MPAPCELLEQQRGDRTVLAPGECPILRDRVQVVPGRADCFVCFERRQERGCGR